MNSMDAAREADGIIDQPYEELIIEEPEPKPQPLINWLGSGE